MKNLTVVFLERSSGLFIKVVFRTRLHEESGLTTETFTKMIFSVFLTA